MKKLIVLIAILFITLSGVQAKAYELQIAPGGLVDSTGLSTVMFDVVFNPQGTVTLDTYAFNISYDAAELTWNSGLSNFASPAPLFSQILGPVNDTSGSIGNINGSAFSGNATLSSPFTLAELAFDVGSSVQDGSADVWFDTAVNPQFGFTVNGAGVLMSDIPINNSLPDVAVAPEPISSTLFLVGAATLGFRRFRGKKQAV